MALWTIGGTAGCGAAEPPAKNPVSASSTRSGAGADGVASRAGAARDDAGFGAEIAAALRVVSVVRGLEARGKVRGAVIERSEMVERLTRQMHEDVPPEVVAAQGEMLFALGTTPVEFDLERSLLEMMEDQLAGFYEPDDKTLYVMEDLGGAERAATLTHELVHVLQDQHFGLGGLVEYREDATDEQSAVHTLAEGDATSAMLDVVQGRPGFEVSDAALGMMLRSSAMLGSGGSVPGIVKRSVVASYVDGVVAVHAARRVGGWAGVNALWARLPRSTEQMLHPEKWLADEIPTKVAVPAPPASGAWRVAYHDIEGEQSLRILFEEWMPRFKAEAAGAGWGGDRVAVFEKGDLKGLGWQIVFDDEAAAERAGVAFARGIVKRSGGGDREGEVSEARAAAAIAGGELCEERDLAGPFAVVRRGKSIGVVAGPYRRSGKHAVSAGDCQAALAWCRAVAERPSGE
ncbi:MAG: hypothetical protein JW751_07140 [Polyangiaceae bacterium]|nr:hypothetical protein [Polyangiaceae bacterium]